MTIEELKIQAAYCFGAAPLHIERLGKVNFIFAPNGAGKSTISNTLSRQPEEPAEREAWSPAPTHLPIRVFNEAYRSRVLTEHVDGIFTIGGKSEAVNAEIEAISRAKQRRIEEIEGWRKSIGDGDATPPSGLLGDIWGARLAARDAIFEAHKDVQVNARNIIFEGFRSNRDKFILEALKRHAAIDEPQEIKDWDSLKIRADSLGKDQVARNRIPRLGTTSLISKDDASSVAAKYSHSSSGDLANLIHQLGNEDWVSDGRSYLETSEGNCPFCQEDLPQNFEEKLSDYFEAGYDEAREQADSIKEKADEAFKVLRPELASLEASSPQLVPEDQLEEFNSAIKSVRSSAELLLARLDEKRRHPTHSIEVVDVLASTDRLNALIDEENKAVDQHNRLVSNASAERKKLINDGWTTFLKSPQVDREIRKFKGIEKSKRGRIATFREQIEDAAKLNKDGDDRIAELHHSISNTKEVANRINSLLKAMGFLRFHIDVADEGAGKYRIAREDGSLAFKSLSEGEKSFICFAYYWESLFGAFEANSGPENVVAVIDDPISSLDSDSLFMIASFIRDAADRALGGESNLRQLIVLTHNTQFHHEAAYSAGPSSERRYFRLVKNTNGITSLRDDGNRSNIRGSYALLWDSVVEAAHTDDESDLVRVGIYNIVRRILESYFKTIGKVSDFDRPPSSSPTDGRVLSQFHIWANSGSHTIADDIDQTVDVGRTSEFLRLFQLYFDRQEHGAHFDMMIRASNGCDLLEEGGLFSRDN